MSHAPARAKARLTASAIRARKGSKARIVMVTAYDAMFARLFEEAAVDILLVGDSLGMVIQGRDNTLAVTMQDVLYHCQSVARGSRSTHLVADMPFMSYQASVADALRNAGRLLAEGGVQSVKLEGGQRTAPTIQALVRAGIPVMGHIGLTPQSVHTLGGFRVQGRDDTTSQRLIEDALSVQEAGAYAVVLESIPLALAEQITETLTIPTIGIGAGPRCDGQVLVGYDLLGLSAEPLPRFVKAYASFYADGVRAAAAFVQEVRSDRFPTNEHSYGATAGHELEPRTARPRLPVS